MIYFVRHGETDWNENSNDLGQYPTYQGRIDLPLNQNGIDQALQTAIELRGVQFDRVFCSPLLRARQTCNLIYWGDKPVEIDERIIERDFGEFEGLTRAEFDFNGFWNVHCKQKFQKAESIKDVEKRVFAFIEELRQQPNKNYLVVSHGGIGCVFLSYFKGLPENGSYLSFELPYARPLTLNFSRESKRDAEND